MYILEGSGFRNEGSAPLHYDNMANVIISKYKNLS